MSDEDDEKPVDELRQGFGHLFRAARGAVRTLKREVDKAEMGKAFEDAGREIVRVAGNVKARVEDEIAAVTKAKPAGSQPPPPEPKVEDDEFDGVKPREKSTDAASAEAKPNDAAEEKAAEEKGPASS